MGVRVERTESATPEYRFLGEGGEVLLVMDRVTLDLALEARWLRSREQIEERAAENKLRAHVWSPWAWDEPTYCTRCKEKQRNLYLTPECSAAPPA